MAGLSDGFESFLVPSEDDVRTALTEGLVVLDTNVLLEAYRFAPFARDQLFTVLRSLGERLWVPYQVALEFHRNRLSVIASFDDSYNQAIKVVEEFRLTVEDALSQKIAELSNRVSLSDSERTALLAPISRGLAETQHRLDVMRKRHGLQPGSIIDDPILRTLREILDGKVGLDMPSEQRLQAIKDAGRRAAEKIPPGYKDFVSKDDGSGDYLVWAQTLEEAGRRKLPLLFVTRDAKEDWFLRLRGKTVCGRPELVSEAKRVAGVPAMIMQTHTFLFHARSYLQREVSDETLRQAAELEKRQGGRDMHSVEISPAVLTLMIENAEEKADDAWKEFQAAIETRVYLSRDYRESPSDADAEAVTRRMERAEARLADGEQSLRRARRNLAILKGAERRSDGPAVVTWAGPPQPWYFRSQAAKLQKPAG
jgi:hypothetical protein